MRPTARVLTIAAVLTLSCVAKKGNTDEAYFENKISLTDIIPANSTKEIPFSIDNVAAGAQYAIYVDGYKVEKEEDFIQGWDEIRT